MHISIIGLPNSTKTTIFNALTRGNLETTSYSSGVFEVHTATIDVPDARVDRLSAMFHPRKTIYAQVTYTDVAGLAKGISEGGLSGPLLNTISQSDALLHVVRAFDDPDVPHVEGTRRPGARRRDHRRRAAAVGPDHGRAAHRAPGGPTEEGRRQAGQGGQRGRAGAVPPAARAPGDRRTAARHGTDPAEQKMLRNYGLLTLKPLLIVLNVGDGSAEEALARLAGYAGQHRQTSIAALQGRLEMELAQMPPEEAAEFLAGYGIEEPGLNRVVRVSYSLLGLQSFFTVGRRRGARLDDPGGRERGRGGGGDPHRPGARLHPRRGDRVRGDDRVGEHGGGAAEAGCCGWKARNTSCRTGTS